MSDQTGREPIRPQREQSADHDLLIRLEVKVDALTDEVTDLKRETLSRVAALEAGGARKTDLDSSVMPSIKDHEARIRRLEHWGSVGLGFLVLLQIVLQFFRVDFK